MIWLDGVAADSLPLPDRGLDFGDGLFETLLLKRDRALFLDLHLQRLQRGLQTLGFPDCLAIAREQILSAAVCGDAAAHPWSALRLTVTRGAGPRGYAPPAEVVPRLLLTLTRPAHDCGLMAPPATIGIAAQRWSTQPQLAGIKHLNRLEQVLAAAEGHRAGLDEMVMLDQEGYPRSLTAGNLFLVTGTTIATPRLGHCGIEGTRRRLVMEQWAPDLGFTVEEADLELQELEAADELFYCNSLLGPRPVAAIGAHRWQQHPVCEALYQRYHGALV